jgi:hypothetical protein
MKTTRKRSTKRMTPAEQHARFIEAAKKAEADERPAAFDKVFKSMQIRRKTTKRA